MLFKCKYYQILVFCQRLMTWSCSVVTVINFDTIFWFKAMQYFFCVFELNLIFVLYTWKWNLNSGWTISISISIFFVLSNYILVTFESWTFYVFNGSNSAEMRGPGRLLPLKMVVFVCSRTRYIFHEWPVFWPQFGLKLEVVNTRGERHHSYLDSRQNKAL